MTTILVAFPQSDVFSDVLEHRFPHVRFAYAKTDDEIVPALEATRPDVAFCIKGEGMSGEAMRPLLAFPTVKWIQIGGSGYDHMLGWDPAKVTLTNGAGVLARYLAETVIGALLTLNCGFPVYRVQQTRREWRPRPFRSLSEQTMMIVGLGKIGGWVAHNAKALGMTVIGVRRSGGAHPSTDEIVTPDRMRDALARADAVSLHLRLNDETRALFNADMIGAMKPGAILINTSRGPVVDESAVAESLASGHLGGGYLDVFETEPLSQDSPLWETPNLLITPHASDGVHGWELKFATFFGDNLERWLNGEGLQNVVAP